MVHETQSACVGRLGHGIGKMFWAGVAEGGARGEFRCLIPSVQEFT